MVTPHPLLTPLCLAFSIFLSVPALAQTSNSKGGGLSVELNKITQEETTCAIIFVTKNDAEEKLDNVKFELVFFDQSGLVKNMNVFGFGNLPASRTLVKRFRMKHTKCDDISRILINGSPICGADSAKTEQCGDLTISNRTEIKFSL